MSTLRPGNIDGVRRSDTEGGHAPCRARRSRARLRRRLIFRRAEFVALEVILARSGCRRPLRSRHILSPIAAWIVCRDSVGWRQAVRLPSIEPPTPNQTRSAIHGSMRAPPGLRSCARLIRAARIERRAGLRGRGLCNRIRRPVEIIDLGMEIGGSSRRLLVQHGRSG